MNAIHRPAAPIVNDCHTAILELVATCEPQKRLISLRPRLTTIPRGAKVEAFRFIQN